MPEDDKGYFLSFNAQGGRRCGPDRRQKMRREGEQEPEYAAVLNVLEVRLQRIESRLKEIQHTLSYTRIQRGE